MNNLFNHTNCRNRLLIFIFLLSGIASSGQNSFIPKLDTLALNFSTSISAGDKEKFLYKLMNHFILREKIFG